MATSFYIGNYAGWSGLGRYNFSRLPKLTWGMQLSSNTDYSLGRIWMGLAAVPSAMTVDSPTTNFAAIRYSSTSGDATYECVTGNGSSVTKSQIVGASPSTIFTTMSVAVNSGSVVCNIGPYSATVTSTLPFGGPPPSAFFYNTNAAGTPVNLGVSGFEG